MKMAQYTLPPGIEIFERGWLSANNIFLYGEEDVSLVDSGYLRPSKFNIESRQ